MTITLAIVVAFSAALSGHSSALAEKNLVFHEASVDSSGAITGVAQDKKLYKVRIAGFAFPERTSLRRQAVRLAREFIGGEPVTIANLLVKNGNSTGTVLVRASREDPGKHLRSLGYLLVREGLGRVNALEGPDVDELKSAEREAKADRLGIWSQ